MLKVPAAGLGLRRRNRPIPDRVRLPGHQIRGRPLKRRVVLRHPGFNQRIHQQGRIPNGRMARLQVQRIDPLIAD